MKLTLPAKGWNRHGWHLLLSLPESRSIFWNSISSYPAGEDSWECLGLQEIKPISPKGDQPWIFIGRVDAEALILRPPVAKSWLIGKHPDARRDWRQKEKGAAEDEMVRQHQWFTGHEFEQTPRDVEDRGCWRAAVHGVAKSQTQLSGWTTIQLPAYLSFKKAAMWLTKVSPPFN